MVEEYFASQQRQGQFENALKATLFLDRDGVINQSMPIGQYVTSLEEFQFIEGSVEAISVLKYFFSKTVIVTNQQGVGKQIMTVENLNDIHYEMQAVLKNREAIIDKIYYCPHLSEQQCSCRKPQSGMAYQAKNDFPEIDFHKSVMVGDSPSDIAFGHQLGMKTVQVGNKPHEDIKPDFHFDCLLDFSHYLVKHPITFFT